MRSGSFVTLYNCPREQRLIEDLIIEVIRGFGLDVRYLPRTIVNEHYTFGEDPLSIFQDAPIIEAYLKNVEGFGGEGDLLSKFGLEIRDQATFTIARRRFTEIRTEKLLSEPSLVPLVLEEANTAAPANTCLYVLESGTDEGYSLTQSRPYEGDIIYLPLTGKLYEIKFVEHESLFYQFGTLQTYDLVCELFSYSSERIDTGNTEIDAIETSLSHDILFTQLLKEDGDGLQLEDGDYIIQEFRIEDTDPQANNENFTTEGQSVIDYSEHSPLTGFGVGDEW